MTRNRFTFFAIGLGTGAAILTLLAPRSGKETRRWIGRTGARARDSAAHLLNRGKVQFRTGKKQFQHVLDRVA